MLYSIVASDAADKNQLRLQHREQHRARLRELQEQGRLVLAGPNPAVDSNEPGGAGFTGSLIVAEFDSLESAIDWARQDIYQLSGVYSQLDVKPLIQVMP